MSKTTREGFIELLSSVKRDGIENLIKFLDSSTFFTDPATANSYNSYEGGLADHHMNVYQTLLNYKQVYPELKDLDDSLKIVGLLHDIAYVGCYQKSSKNVPLKGADGKNKKNENGKLIFIEKESYDFYPEAQLPYPSNQLSLITIKQHIKLTKLEDLAILWQRGIQDQAPHNWGIVDRATKKHKLIMLTQFAKKEATLFQDLKAE